MPAEKKLQEAIDRMYWALRAAPCGCCGKWKMVKGIKGVWVTTTVCSRCVALDEYEKITGVGVAICETRE